MTAGLLLVVACGQRGDETSRATPSTVTTSTPPVVASSTSTTVAAHPSARPASAAVTEPGPKSCRDLSSGASAAHLPFAADPRPRGVDTSTPAPWKTLAREHDVIFGIVTASHGLKPNPHFADNWRTMKACGLKRGAYHFLVPQAGGVAQAEVFLGRLGDDLGELPPVLDVEKPPSCQDACCGLPCGHWAGVVQAFVAKVEAATGRRVMMYAVRDFWKECLCNTSRFAERPLWFPAYPDLAFTPRPGYGGWTRWKIHQYVGNVRIAGGVVDLNVAAMPESDLHELVMPPPGP